MIIVLIIIMCKKQVMHNAIAHHPLTDAQPNPEQPAPHPGQPPLYIVQHDVRWYGIPLWPVWVSCPGSVPSQLLLHPWPAHWQDRARS